ncbi:MFS transporter [Coralliovum pocilloporae]|uniref:MFS transporter n=1 Tax=Coralliovum pocilloporae TaxID=3066369 RepID=UPI0033074761
MANPATGSAEMPDWRRAAVMLMLMAIAMQIAFATWWNLLNNFAIEEIGFTGREIGIQQSIREIPGFLAFTAIFLLLFIREQSFALVSLAVMAVGIAATGYFPTIVGLYVTTLIMSVGFHYYETAHQSLSLQWLPRSEAPRVMGRIVGMASFAKLGVFGFIFVGWSYLGLDYSTLFTMAGLVALLIVVWLVMAFPAFKQTVPQHKKLILRKRYWLYYALTFMSGARRQIFIVFAGFLMVERFGYDVHEIAGLFIINSAFSMVFSPVIGELIARFGERRILTLEYIGLIGIFTAYAFVSDPWVAASLYVLDHAFFAMAIAMKTYFQKIADPADIAPTTGVAFTINHIAAVIIPVIFGLIWLVSPAAVFLAGAAMAAVSLALARLVPMDPDMGRETIVPRLNSVPAE